MIIVVILILLPLIYGDETYVLPLSTLKDISNYKFADYHWQIGVDAVVVSE